MIDPAMRFTELAAMADQRIRYADDLESVEGPSRVASMHRVRASKFIWMARDQIENMEPVHRRYAEARLTMLDDRLTPLGPGEWQLVP